MKSLRLIILLPTLLIPISQVFGITADFTGSAATNLAPETLDTPANLNLGTTDATWSALSTVTGGGGSLTVRNDSLGWMTGNYLYIGLAGNEVAPHSTTATLDFDSPQTLAGTIFSVDAEMQNSGAKASKGLIVDIYDGATLLASINFGNSNNLGYRGSIGELNAAQEKQQDLFSTTDGSKPWEDNGTGATVTMNFGASTYTVSAVSEINGNLGISTALNYLNTPGTTFDKIVLTADQNKASWALDNLFVGPAPAVPEFSADSPQDLTSTGATETLLIPFTNISTTTDLLVSGVTLSGTDVALFTTPTVWTSPVAANGGSGTISLPFAPTAPGNFTVDLEVASDDPDSPETITVNVAVIAPVAEVTPSAVDFGTDTATFTMDVTIANTASLENLEIYSADIYDDPAGVFSVGAVPAPIAPGGSAIVTVTYTPGANIGYLTGTLEIDTSSSASTQSYFEIPLSARESGAPIADFTADFEGSFVDTSATDIPTFNWLRTPANLSLGSAGGGWGGASTSVDPVSTQFTGLGVSDGSADGMTGHWLLIGNNGNTIPTDSTDNAHTYVSIELDTPRPLDGTSISLDMNKLTSGSKYGEIWITGKDASGTELFQMLAGSGGVNRNDIATCSDASGTVDEKLVDVWGTSASQNNVAYTVQLALGTTDYSVTADFGTSIIAGTYLAAGDLSSIEFHAIDSKAQWGIDNIKVIEGPLATPLEAWVGTFGLNPAWETGDDPSLDGRPEGDPDGDGLNNLLEFATDDNPTNPASSGKVVGIVQDVGGSDVLTLTLPVRGAPAFSADGSQLVSVPVDGLVYRVQGATDLLFSGANQSTITEVTPTISPAPSLNAGWSYRTFRTDGDTTSDIRDFIRAVIEAAP